MSDSLQIAHEAATQVLPVTLSLTHIIKRLLVDCWQPEESKGVTLNFRDPDYSADSGGFHPVEIRLEYSSITGKWHLCYITDFAYFGRPYSELEKEIDFNFSDGTGYQAYVGYHPLNHFKGLYRLWEANFRSYVIDEVYLITLTWD